MWSNYVILWLKKWVSHIKFDKKSLKLIFSTVFTNICIWYDAKQSNNGLKWSKRSNVVKLCDFMVKKMDFSHQI